MVSSAAAATAPHAVSVGELVDRALHSGADHVSGLPLGRLLFGADAELQVTQLVRGKSYGAGAVGGAGALRACRAGAALALGEPCHDQRGGGGRGGRVGTLLARADLSLGAGDLLLVVVDVEVVPGQALVAAVLAGGVALQRTGDGDLVFTGSVFQVGQRGVAGVAQVLGGQQAATRQAGVDAGQDLAVVGGGDIRDRVGAVGGTGLGQMSGEPLPADDVSVPRVTSRGVVGRDDRPRRRRQTRPALP